MKMTMLDQLITLLKKSLRFGKLNQAAQMVRTFVEVTVYEKHPDVSEHHLPSTDNGSVGQVPAAAEPNTPISPSSFGLPGAKPHPVVQEQNTLDVGSGEIDFDRQGNLEEYARELSVSTEIIEEWLSAGILCPNETRVAEKLLKIMRDRAPHQPDSIQQA